MTLGPGMSTDLTAVMQRAVEHARQHVAAGGLPFVGVLLLGDATMSDFGVNRVRETADPTAHAEIEAMRAVIAQSGPELLNGATLVATGEPCSLCYAWAARCGISRCLYAVDVHRAAALGFDYRGGDPGPEGRALQADAAQLSVPDAAAPFIDYLSLHH